MKKNPHINMSINISSDKKKQTLLPILKHPYKYNSNHTENIVQKYYNY
jgi:hypothetical protein